MIGRLARSLDFRDGMYVGIVLAAVIRLAIDLFL